MSLKDDAQDCGNNRNAHQIDPECVERHPGRNDTRDELCIGKVLCGEYSHRDGKEQPPEWQSLVEPVFLRKLVLDNLC